MTTLDLEAQSATRANPRTPSPRERLKLPLAPSLEHRRLQCYALLMATDSLALAGSMLGVGSALHGSLSMAFQHLLLLLPFYLIGALSFDAYSLPALTSVRFSRRRALISLVAAFTTLIFLAFFAKVSDQISRVSIGANFAACSLMLLMVRSSIQPLIARLCGPTAQNVLILDDGGMPVRIPHAWHISTRDHLLVPNRSDPTCSTAWPCS
jgi:hypothetical protein